jgi:putative OPT family oligopeptide transporter
MHNGAQEPFISASQKLPEITPKAIVLAIILTITLAAANAYLGLKVGTTVSASIPAAVISMGILRFFRRSNILENNIVQTAASSGEALVAGIAYILPALIILHYWRGFNYQETLLIGIIGGILGVLFSVPLRRVLLEQKVLRFPEGTAIGHVLKASTESQMGLKYLIKGSLVGGCISLLQAGFQVVSDSLEIWFKSGNNIIYGFGAGFDPALIAAGYIVGINVAVSTLVGVVIGWIAGVPILTHIYGAAQVGDAASAAIDMWHTHIRYIGVGTMLIGGLWTLLTLLKPIAQGLRSSFTSVKSMHLEEAPATPRTERDIPMTYIAWAMLLLLVPLSFFIYHTVNNPILQLGITLKLSTVAIALIFVVLIGFTLSAVSGYFAGLVGSTNSPGSGLTLSALLIISLLILVVFGYQLHSMNNPAQKIAAEALAIIVTAIVAASAVITNETIQDLKAGQIVGATPWKQQAMLILGTIVSAFTLPPILQLLFNAYGIGGVFPHPGMDPSQMLAAPQAGLMAALVQGVFSHDLPWAMIITGAIIAIFCIILNAWLHTKGTRLPVLAVGLGIYLPLEASVPLILGGVASFIIESILKRRLGKEAEGQARMAKQQQRGLILACGLVAGAALMGVILAIPFAIAKSTDVLKLVPDSFMPIANTLGVIVTIGLVFWMYRIVCKNQE